MSFDFDKYYSDHLSLSRMLGVDLHQPHRANGTHAYTHTAHHSDVRRVDDRGAGGGMWDGPVPEEEWDDEEDGWDEADEREEEDDGDVEDHLEQLLDLEIKKNIEKEIQDEYDEQKRMARLEEEDEEWEDD